MLGRVGRADALVLGPGLGREPEAHALARNVAAAAELPLVLDADGLNAHAGKLASLARRSAPTVLTPHAGELARLLESTAPRSAPGACAAPGERPPRRGAIVVLKGDDTLVADADGAGRRQPRRRPGAGDGRHRRRALRRDRGVARPGHGAVRGGLRRRARARARRTRGAREIGAEGVIASDVIAALPRALRQARAAVIR